jgi:transposase
VSDRSHPNDQYTEEEMFAVLELAATTSIKNAARVTDVARNTIYRWIDRYPDKWSDLVVDPTKGKRKVAQKLDVLVERYTAVEHEMLNDLEKRETPQDPKELAAVLKAVGSNRQAAVAGSRSISGDPEVHEHNVNFPAIEALMADMLASVKPPAALPVPNEADDA